MSSKCRYFNSVGVLTAVLQGSQFKVLVQHFVCDQLAGCLVLLDNGCEGLNGKKGNLIK